MSTTAYKHAVDVYRTTGDARRLMMALPMSCSFPDLLCTHLPALETPKTFPLSDIHADMRGSWEAVTGSTSRARHITDVRIRFNTVARDAAVCFAVGVSNGTFTSAHRSRLYNVYLYTQTHPCVFTRRIRHHVRTVLESKPHLLSKKQWARVAKERERHVGSTTTDTKSDEHDTSSDTSSDSECLE